MKLVEPTAIVAPQSERPAAMSLQDVFTFGELGVPAGEPGSFALTAVDEAALDAAIAHSRSAERALPRRLARASGAKMPRRGASGAQ